jgi:cysteine desulfurase
MTQDSNNRWSLGCRGVGSHKKKKHLGAWWLLYNKKHISHNVKLEACNERCPDNVLIFISVLRYTCHMKRIYMDYAAATPVDERVLAVMQPFWRDIFANPQSLHQEGRQARQALDQAQAQVAEVFGVGAREVTFTGSGTEANSLAIRGLVNELVTEGAKLSDLHVITSTIEHASVRNVLADLRAQGLEFSAVPVTSAGIINLEELKNSLRPNTVLVSVMYANSEIGTVQPIRDIARIIKEKHEQGFFHLTSSNLQFPFLHTDASQALLYLDPSPERLGADLVTLDAQKVFGPKGVGVLLHRHQVPLRSLFYPSVGKLRPGTPNLAGVAGAVKAIEIARTERADRIDQVRRLQELFFSLIDAKLPTARINGSRRAVDRLPSNISISFPDVEHEFLAVQLDARGIACATKSACQEGQEVSHVLSALPQAASKNALRFSLGPENTVDEVENVVKILGELLATS